MKTMTPRDINNHFWEAIVKGGIFPYYQPQFNHTTHKIIGAEALMRWKPPGLDMQSPTGFIPVLEESGLIHEADLFVFEQICDSSDGAWITAQSGGKTGVDRSQAEMETDTGK